MLRDFEAGEFPKYGIQVNGSEMKNGELRFRLNSVGSAYIRTEAHTSKGWQNSHFHSEQTELFLVEKGCVQFATMKDGVVSIKRYAESEYFSVAPMIAHNMLLNDNSITHCIKYDGNPDWNACPELDEYLKGGNE